MSQMKVTDKRTGKSYDLNVTQFRSPMTAAITSVQTKAMLQHFPIRCGQPDINFTVKFTSQDDKHVFQGFVRQHQLMAAMEDNTWVTLWWPERNINNWTGYIVQYGVSERRFEVAPIVTFGVSLVDSLMSEKTTIASKGIDLDRILGPQIAPYIGYRDTILVPPTYNRELDVNPQDGPAPEVPTPPSPISGGGGSF